MNSKFGKGLTYCLGLFLAHEYLHREWYDVDKENKMGASLWFNGASDHLYELEIPEQFPTRLKNRIKKFQQKCLDLGHGIEMYKATKDDSVWALNEAKELLILIDKQLNIKAIKGEYE